LWAAVAIVADLISAAQLSAEQPIPLEQAISRIEAGAPRVQSYVWHFHYSRHKLADSRDPTSIANTLPDYFDGAFFYDITSGRYVLEFERVSEWGGGVTPYIAERSGWSFDGQAFRRWQRQRHGTELPPIESAALLDIGAPDPSVGPMIATITTAQDAQGEFSAYAIGSGLAYFPPFGFLYLDEDRRVLWTLPQLLRRHRDSGNEISVTELSDRTWQIERPSDGIAGGRERFFFDPERGFVMTGAEMRDQTAVYRRIVSRIEQVADHLWVPVEITDYNVFSADADRTLVDDLKVNSQLTPEELQLRFPLGTQVDDFVNERFYVVGAGVEDRVQMAQDFVQRHGERRPAIHDRAISSRTWTVFIAAATCVLLIALAYVLRRLRSKVGRAKDTAGSE
jgi:hypothetical protein